MFKIVEFQDRSIAIVNAKWIVEGGLCHWPAVGTKKHMKLVQKSSYPAINWKKYPVKVHRATGQFMCLPLTLFPDNIDLACVWEERLQHNTDFESSDATEKMLHYGKRRR